MPEPAQATDEELMRAYAAGDVQAFEALYNRHETGLFRFVRRLLGSALAAQADEVFQDTWTRIIAARGTFSPRGAAWRTWAFTIAHNAAMDRLRLGGREVSLEPGFDTGEPLDWLSSVIDEKQVSVEDEAYWRAAGRQLLQCLDTLPAPQRAAFLLHHEDGASVEELARHLGLPFETAKSRLRYALQKLRGCMGAYLQPGEAAA
jgi:RNA polymerase sigma factor (sigma-70 family)